MPKLSDRIETIRDYIEEARDSFRRTNAKVDSVGVAEFLGYIFCDLESALLDEDTFKERMGCWPPFPSDVSPSNYMPEDDDDGCTNGDHDDD